MLLCLGGCVTASPMLADLSLLEVDDGTHMSWYPPSTERIQGFGTVVQARQGWPTMDNNADSSSEVMELCEYVQIFGTLAWAPIDASHTCEDLLNEPETVWVLSVEKATDQTASVWPSSTFSSALANASHTHTDLSCEPEMMQVPSVEKAMSRQYLCGPQPPSAQPQLMHPTPRQNCWMSQRQCRCHQWRRQQSRWYLCGPQPPSAQPTMHLGTD